MRDIPVFTTENGAGSLVLKEIPYKAIAYVKVHSTQSPSAFVADCITFCRAVGAEEIYASGHESLESYPFHTSILEMHGSIDSFPETDAAIFPVTEKTLSSWCELYNKKMCNVPNAAHMTSMDGDQLLARGDGYFVHSTENLIGIGIASGSRIDAVASLKPGAGKDIVSALSHALSSDVAIIEVASANERAMRLYHSLGFVSVREISKWYQIF